MRHNYGSVLLERRHGRDMEYLISFVKSVACSQSGGGTLVHWQESGRVLYSLMRYNTPIWRDIPQCAV